MLYSVDIMVYLYVISKYNLIYKPILVMGRSQQIFAIGYYTVIAANFVAIFKLHDPT